MTTTTFDRAVEALHLAEVDPGRSASAASTLARAARRAGDHAAASVAERALGVAALHLRDTDVAARHLRVAAVLGRRAGDSTLVIEARLRLVAVLTNRGRPAAALREMEAALTEASGLDRARALAQKGAMLVQLGRNDAAFESLTAAVPLLRAAGDLHWLKRALSNRGLASGRRFRFADAEADLREALRINVELGIDLSVAFVEQNLGWLESLRGEVPRALEHLDQAEKTLRKLNAQIGFLLQDRAELLFSVGLVAEARQVAEEAVVALEAERQRIALPEVRLLLARLSVLDGDPDGGLRQASRAVRELSRQNRPEWGVLARFVVLTCRASGAGRDRVALRTVSMAADRLAAAGWADAAVEARLLAASLCADRVVADPPSAVASLAEAAGARSSGPATRRALGWYAEALRRERVGQSNGALRAAAAGLRVLDGHRAGLGAADLRVGAGQHRVALAGLGLRIAVASGQPGRILTWAEHNRASHLLLPPLRPPDDAEYATDLAAWRAAASAASGGGDPAALRRQVAAERRIRDRTRRQPGTVGMAATPVALDALNSSLGEAALVEYVAVDGMLHALVVVCGSARLVRLGPAAPVRDLIDRLPFALHRLTTGRAATAARRLLDDAVRRLDTALLVPVATRVGDRPLLVVPIGRLQSLPWSLLPSCVGRPVTVAPSATAWLAAGGAGAALATLGARGAGHRGYRAVAVAGPGLPGAHAEAKAVAAIHRTTALTGPDATAETVLQALAGADIAHLAAHGRVHQEHPLFSSLLLADGPLTGYDLERLRPVPRLVVLAACDTGRHVVRAGDELLGLTATLLGRGAQQVVASVVPVADTQTEPLMTALHARLAAGASAAEALATAQEHAGRDGAESLAAAAGFVCLGGTFRL